MGQWYPGRGVEPAKFGHGFGGFPADKDGVDAAGCPAQLFSNIA